MIPVYIGSTVGYSGKSLVTLGIGLKLLEDGLKVGYMKPLGRTPVVEGGVLTDGDAAFMKRILGLPDPVRRLCPVVYTQDLVAGALKGRGKDYSARAGKAFSALARGRDVVLVGGARDLHDGAFIGLSGVSVARSLKAVSVVVDPFNGEICVDRLLAAKDALGPRLLGAVINKVPPSGLDYLKAMVGPYLKRKGIPLLGVIPADRLLSAVTVGQLAESLGGEVMCCRDRLDEMVENFLIGAMDAGSALKYFRKTPDKAVITGGHRSDIQLAALETSTKCLVLTGGLPPNDLIIARAGMAGVPIILVKQDTLYAVERFEALLGRTRIREEKKVARARELMQRHFDYEAFCKGAGIKAP